MNTADFNKLIESKIKMITKLFFEKNGSYKTNEDPIANFTRGAALRYGDDTTPKKYEALKDYLGKHIAHLYNNDIDGPKLSESWRDLAVYSIIAMAMCDMHVTEKGIQGTTCDKMFIDESAKFPQDKVFTKGDRVVVISKCIYNGRTGTVLKLSMMNDELTALVAFDGVVDMSTIDHADGSYSVPKPPDATIFWASELKVLKTE